MVTGKGGTRSEPDLLASLPGEGPALPEALGAMREAVRVEIAALREEVAGLRRAAEADRPAPATRADLELWGGRLEDRVGSPPSPAGGGAEDAARAAATADRIEAAVERLGERVAARFGGLEARLGQAGPPPEDGSAAEIETALKTMSTMKFDSNQTATELVRLRRAISGLHFRWRAFLAPWVAFVFVLGMALESRAHLLYRWLWVE